MIINEPKSLLFIEPENAATEEPVIDSYTKKMTAAYRSTVKGFLVDGEIIDAATGGVHHCICQSTSDDVNHVLPDKSAETNSLCIHYLAFHRGDVPEEELRKVASLTYGEEDPTDYELKLPPAQTVK